MISKSYILDSDVKSLKRLPGIGEKTSSQNNYRIKRINLQKKNLSELTGNAIISEK